MKKLNFFLVLILIPFFSFSQRGFEYKVSLPYTAIDGYQKLYAHNKDNLIAVKKRGNTFTIQKFNSSKAAPPSVQAYEDFPRGTILEELVFWGEKCILFYAVWDKPNKTEQLFYREIDPDAGKFKGRNRLLFEVNSELTYAPQFIAKKVNRGAHSFMFREKNQGSFIPKYSYTFSKEKKKLLIQYRKVPVVKRDNISYDVIGMHVYDIDLEKDWNKEVTMPYTEKKMDNLHYTIDEDGTVYILSKTYNDNTIRDKKNEIANYQIELLTVKNGHLKTHPFSINLKDGKFISKLWIHETGEDEITCAGFYNNGFKSFAEKMNGGNSINKISTRIYNKWKNHADGICLFKMNKDLKIVDRKYYEIPLEILNQYERQGVQNKNNKRDEKGVAQFESLELRNFITQKDGSIILIGEQNYVRGFEQVNVWKFDHKTKLSSFGADLNRDEFTEYFNDLLITKIDNKGKMLWMRKLPKQQSGNTSLLRLTTQTGGLSFNYSYNESTEQHYISFLDNGKNINLGINDSPCIHMEGKGGFFTCYTIDDMQGSVNKHSIFNLSDINGYKLYQFYTHRVTPLNNGEFLIEAYKKDKEDVLIKIKTK